MEQWLAPFGAGSWCLESNISCSRLSFDARVPKESDYGGGALDLTPKQKEMIAPLRSQSLVCCS